MVRRTRARIGPPLLPQFTGGDCEMSQTEPGQTCEIASQGDMRSGRFDMLRKIMMACVAVATVAMVAISIDDASARGRGGGHRGGGHGGFHRHGGFGPSFGFYPYGVYGYGYGVGCYRTVRVYTPYGPRLRRVWVC